MSLSVSATEDQEYCLNIEPPEIQWLQVIATATQLDYCCVLCLALSQGLVVLYKDFFDSPVS